jgi:PKD repeat protein
MNRKQILYTLLFALALGVAALPVVTSAAPTALTIPVEGADGVLEVDASAFSRNLQLPSTYFPVRMSDGIGELDMAPISGTLESLLGAIPTSYFAVRSSDGVNWLNMDPITGTLESLLGEIPTYYFPIRSSDGVNLLNVNPITGTLKSLIDQIPPYYFPVRVSDGVFIDGFEYPRELLGDTVPPQIFNVSIDKDGATAEWQTNEFATSEVWYGTEQGSYTHVVSSTRWTKNHYLALSGLTEGMDYFLIRSVDQSGNLGEYYVPGYSISGKVSNKVGAPIPDVVISLSSTQVALTDERGDYVLEGVLEGDHVITPSYPYYDFTPESVAVTVANDLTGYDFVGSLNVANFTASPTEGFAPLTTTFTDTSTGGHTYTTTLWSFGDGMTSTQASPTHTYTSPGAYTVTLMISGTVGTDTMTRSNYVNVYEPIDAGFIASPRQGAPPLTVQFTDTSSGPAGTWAWTFGDGKTSSLRHPAHTYTAVGLYTVSLEVQASGGSALWPGGSDALTRQDYIKVMHTVYLPLTLRND